MYINLKIEMVRKGISIAEISTLLELSERTVRNKLNGTTDFTWLQVCKIQNTFFGNLTKDYLFDSSLNEQQGA